jgi:Cu-processing system ATP-binding protein
LIQITDLHKSFGKLIALNSVACHFEKGSVTAVVGPNGSGKTTMIKCILGLVKADKGDILIEDNKLNGDWLYKRDIGYMPQLARFPENLVVSEIIRMVKDIRANENQYDEELYHQFKLARDKSKKLRTLSGGTRQKLSAMIAFLFNPKILILDEPTAGLDPVSSGHLKDKILKAKTNGKTFIITSHIMSELEELSDNLIFLLDGKIHFQGTIKNIMTDTHEKKLERAVAWMMEKHAV